MASTGLGSYLSGQTPSSVPSGTTSGQAPTTSTVIQTNVPPELAGYAQQVLGAANAQTINDINNPSNLPMSQIAGLSPLQTQAMSGIGDMQASGANDVAAGLAGLAGTSQFTGQNVNQFMSPYIQDVINQQQQGAIRSYANQLPQMAGLATQMGGLGGTRQALVNSEAQKGLQQQLQGIQATGYQNAFQNAQQQYNTQNQTQLAASGLLNQIGQNQYAQNAGILQAQLGAGNLLQQQQQNIMNNQYQNQLNAYNNPYQLLSQEMGLIHGTPTAQAGQYNYATPPTAASQLFGTAGGIYNLFGSSANPNTSTSAQTSVGHKAGGPIRGFKAGGIVTLAGGGSVPSKMGALMSREKQIQQANPSMPANQVDAQTQQELQAMPGAMSWQDAFALMQYNKTHPMTPQAPVQEPVVVGLAKQVLASNAAQNQPAQMPMMQPQAQPQAQSQQSGVANLPAPNIGQHYAAGGIVAFDEGGPTRSGADVDVNAPLTFQGVGSPTNMLSDLQNAQMTFQGVPDPTELEKLSALEQHYIDPRVPVDPQLLQMSRMPGGVDALRQRYGELRAQDRAKGIQNIQAIKQQEQAQQQQQLAGLASRAGVSLPSPMSASAAQTKGPIITTPDGQTGAAQAAPVDVSKYYSKGDANLYGGIAGGGGGAGMGDDSYLQDLRKQLDEERSQPQKSVTDFVKELRSLRPDEKTDATHQFLDAISKQEDRIAANTEEGRRLARAKAFFTIAQKGTPAAGGLLGGIAAGGSEYADAMAQINKDTEAAQQRMMTARYEAARAAENENKDDLKTAIAEYTDAQRDRSTNLNAQRQLAVALYQAKGQNSYYRTLASAQAAQQRMYGTNAADMMAYRRAKLAGDEEGANRIAAIMNVTSGNMPAGITAGAGVVKAQTAAQASALKTLMGSRDYTTALATLAKNPNDIQARALKNSLELAAGIPTEGEVNRGNIGAAP